MSDESAYHRRRAVQHEALEKTGEPSNAAIHRTMAKMHRDRADVHERVGDEAPDVERQIGT